MEREIAGRIYKYTERSEVTVIASMRDLDEILAHANAQMAPDKQWSRTDFLLLFFLDDATDALLGIQGAVTEDGS